MKRSNFINRQRVHNIKNSRIPKMLPIFLYPLFSASLYFILLRPRMESLISDLFCNESKRLLRRVWAATRFFEVLAKLDFSSKDWQFEKLGHFQSSWKRFFNEIPWYLARNSKVPRLLRWLQSRVAREDHLQNLCLIRSSHSLSLNPHHHTYDQAHKSFQAHQATWVDAAQRAAYRRWISTGSLSLEPDCVRVSQIYRLQNCFLQV